MKHYFLILILLGNVLLPIQKLFGNEQLYVRGIYQNKSTEQIAVLGVPYFIACSDEDTFLSYDPLYKRLTLNTLKDNSNWFIFTNHGNQNFNNARDLYEIVMYKSNLTLESNGKKTFSLRIKSKGTHNAFKVQVVLTSPYTDPEFLSHDAANKSASFTFDSTNKNTEWFLKSAYDVSQQLGYDTLDKKLNLKSLKKCAPGSKLCLSPDMLSCLYKLQCSGILKFYQSDNDEEYVVSLPDSFFEKGIFISAAAHTAISIYHLENYGVGIGSTKIEASGSVQMKTDASVLVIPSGKTLCIKPVMPLRANIAQLSKLEIRCQKTGLTKHEDNSIDLAKIFSEKKLQRAGFTIVVDENHIEANFSDVNGLGNPGTMARTVQFTGDSLAQSFGKEGNKIANRLAEGVENLGYSIEKSSLAISEALISASENMSLGIQLSAQTLANSFLYASKTFELSVATLRKSLDKASEDLKDSITNLSWHLTRSFDVLSRSLNDSASILGDSLDGASNNFRDAFTEVSTALKSTGKELSDSLDRASTKFHEGMKCLESAADRLSKTRVKHSVSLSHIIRVAK